MTRRTLAGPLSAVLLALAQPPLPFGALVFVALAPAAVTIHETHARPRGLVALAARGAVFGVLVAIFLFYWIPVGLWRYRPALTVAFVVPVAIGAAYGAVLFAFTGWLLSRRVPLPVAFPVVWTALEWTVAHLGGLAFPWFALAVPLAATPALVQGAELVGARGLGFGIALVNAAFALAWIRRGDRSRALRLVTAAVAGLSVAAVYGWHRMATIRSEPGIPVVLLQPAVRLEDKWSPAGQDRMVGELNSYSGEAAGGRHAALVVWPETALPADLALRPDWAADLAAHARMLGALLLVGALDGTSTASGPAARNAAFLFEASGARVQPVTHKRRLVPLVEGRLAPGEPGPVYHGAAGRFGVAICFEITWAGLVRDYRRRGAEYLVNISNDAWFTGTGAPHQHAAHLVLRAVENRMSIARSANTGFTEIVDPAGRRTARARLGERAAVSGSVPIMRATTPYTYLGDWTGVAALGLVALLGAMPRRLSPASRMRAALTPGIRHASAPRARR